MKKKLRKEFNKIKEKGYKIVDIRQNPFNPTNGNKGRYFEFHVYVEKQPTKEQLLEKAKRDYPEGTIYHFNSADGVITCVVRSDDYIQNKHGIWVANSSGWLLYEGKWAHIIKTPVIKVQDKWLYEGDDYYEIYEPEFILKKQVAQKDVSEYYEHDSKFKQFLTKQSALDYVLEEAKSRFEDKHYKGNNVKEIKFGKKIFLSLYSDNRYMICSFDNSTVCLWTENDGFVAEPIKEEVPEWVVCLRVNNLSKNELFVNKVYKVDEYNSKQGQYWVKCDLDGEVYEYSEKRFRPATKPEIEAHKLGFHIGDVITDIHTKDSKTINSFYYVHGDLCFDTSSSACNYILSCFTKEDPNELMLGEYEVIIGIDKLRIRALDYEVTKEEWMEWYKIFISSMDTFESFGLKLGNYLTDYFSVSESISICSIQNVTIAQIEAITNRLNDL